MPQINAAKKALRVSQRKRQVNDRWRERVRQAVRAAKAALTSGQKEAATTVIQALQSAIDRAAQHRVIHPNRAARLKSRLTNSLSASRQGDS